MASTGEVSRLSRRPALDGIRALAVLFVIAQHSGATVLGGIGVPLFFALSGYLITGLLLDEQRRDGRFNLRAFYWRRAARLLPALLAMVVISDALFLLLGRTWPVIASAPALLYVSNYAEIHFGVYLVVYGHTWSLAVEEHFYIVWPLVLLACRRLPLRSLLGVTMALCGLDIVWRSVLVAHGASSFLIGVGSIERADSLLYGCAAAMLVRLGYRPAWWVAPAGVVGLVAYHFWTPATPQIGSAVFGLACAAIVCGADHSPAAARWLSGRPLQAIGLRSYGMYLWHMPTLALFAAAGVTGWLGTAAGACAAVVAAWVSYRWLEVPAQRWARARHHGPVIVPEVAETVPPDTIDRLARFTFAPVVPTVPSN